MAPKRKARKKKKPKTKKREPDGKNSLAVESEGSLNVEELPSNYTQSIICKVTWDTLGGIPCFTCNNVKRCGIRQPISPVTCHAINAWLEYESIPPKERQLSPPDFWIKIEDKRNIKLEGAAAE